MDSGFSGLLSFLEPNLTEFEPMNLWFRCSDSGSKAGIKGVSAGFGRAFLSNHVVEAIEFEQVRPIGS